jgi:hypothetical protein
LELNVSVLIKNVSRYLFYETLSIGGIALFLGTCTFVLVFESESKSSFFLLSHFVAAAICSLLFVGSLTAAAAASLERLAKRARAARRPP